LSDGNLFENGEKLGRLVFENPPLIMNFETSAGPFRFFLFLSESH